MTISNNPPILTHKDLLNLSYSLSPPFILELEDNAQLYVGEVVRCVPQRRFVVFADWQGKQIVAKLFIDLRHAKRHLDNDTKGIKILTQNKIPTPQIEHTSRCKEKRTHVLILEKISNVKNLEQLWESKVSIESLMPLLKNIMVELATQHVLGVIQNDLHLKNFLIEGTKIYTLDGAEILLAPALLPKKQSMQNLALFLSQLGTGVKIYQRELFLHYAKSRGWLLKAVDLTFLFILIERYNAARWHQYSKKIFRNCTEFVSFKKSSKLAVIDRKYLTQDFLTALADPELLFKKQYTLLKAGRSATVIQVQINNLQFVVKRYNIKNIWHWIRRALRSTRAMTSWRLAHKMHLFGIATAKPVACIESRKLGLRGVSYYITEYVAGQHADKYLQQHRNQVGFLQTIDRITVLLKNLLSLNLSHGDLKITNILIASEGMPVLIDLDGAQEHDSIVHLRRQWKKDMSRFLRNFKDDPELGEKFIANFINRDDRESVCNLFVMPS